MKSLNYREMKTSLENEGFALARGFIDPALISQIRRELKEIFLFQLKRLNIVVKNPDDEKEFAAGLFRFFEQDMKTFMNTGLMCQHVVSIHRLGTDPRIMEVLKGLGLGFPNISTRPVVYFNSKHLAKSEGFWKSPPHQDWRSIQGSLNLTVLWLPLIDIDVSLGALEIVPRSHFQGLRETIPDDHFRQITQSELKDQTFVPVPTKAGDALFFSGFLVHRSGMNSTDRLRWSCHFRYNDLSEETYIQRGFPHPYSYKPQLDLLTPDFPLNEKLVERLNRKVA